MNTSAYDVGHIVFGDPCLGKSAVAIDIVDKLVTQRIDVQVCSFHDLRIWPGRRARDR